MLNRLVFLQEQEIYSTFSIKLFKFNFSFGINPFNIKRVPKTINKIPYHVLFCK